MDTVKLTNHSAAHNWHSREIWLNIQTVPP